MLGWPDEGRSYDRIKLSLLRIKGVNYFYDNAWWDSRLKQWTTKAFSIIDNVEINDSRMSDGQGTPFPSRIKWNEVVFDSFRAGYLRSLDFQLAMSLRHAISLRIYRFILANIRIVSSPNSRYSETCCTRAPAGAATWAFRQSQAWPPSQPAPGSAAPP